MKSSGDRIRPIQGDHKSVMIPILGGLIIILTILACTLPFISKEECNISIIKETEPVVDKGMITFEFSLETCHGDPITLDEKEFANRFFFKEDGNDISNPEHQVKIQRIPSRLEFLLLVDMSDRMKNPTRLSELISAVNNFIEIYGQENSIGIYTFEGGAGAEIEELVAFTDDPKKIQDAIKALESYQFEDPSSNVYGAMEMGLKILDSRNINPEGSKYVTSLVVFTGGIHRAGSGAAGYPSLEEVESLIADSNHPVVVIDLSGKIKEEVLGKLGADGSYSAAGEKDLQSALSDLVDLPDCYYVVS